MTGTAIRRLATKMRRNPTSLERQAALYLKQLQIKFKAQCPVGCAYILDFIGKNQPFILEVDGPHHDEPMQQQKDRRRDALLEAAGFYVIRLSYRDLSIERLKAEIDIVPFAKRCEIEARLVLAVRDVEISLGLAYTPTAQSFQRNNLIVLESGLPRT